MKKTSVKLMSLVLAVIMLFSGLGASASAISLDGVQGGFQKGVTAVVDKVLTSILSILGDVLNEPSFFKSESTYTNDNFYSGDDEFLTTDEAAANSWSLGYSNVSLIPTNYLDWDIYLGGYIMIENGFSNKVEGVIDDMKARVIAIDDGSGRGISLFATIDCIGMTNKDIKQIRERFASAFAAKYPDKKLVSVNVFSTHTHSCIDTEGLWTGTVRKAMTNLIKNVMNVGTLEQGTNAEYMEFLYEKVSGAMLKACDKMTTGTMTYAEKDITDAYFNNKNRPSATALDTTMRRLTFQPDDVTIRPTMIVNMAAHPDVAGLPTSDNSGREISGDYIYYMGEVLGEAGYNFMFFNGAICGIYMARGATNDGVDLPKRYMQSMRYGYELGRIALSLTLTVDEIKADPVIADDEQVKKDMAESESYTLWYENWTPVTETDVAPVFNIKLSTAKVHVTNPLIKMVGKLNLANYDIVVIDSEYYVYVEIGYIEFGDTLKVAMVPGEFCSDLHLGGASLTAAGSYSGKDFGYPTVVDIFGEDTAVFGLANDAVGYIVPDNDYVNDAGIYGHYHELISLGEETGSSVMKGLVELKNSIA